VCVRLACESASMIPLPQQTPFELHYMHGLLRDLPRPLSVLEIGVYEGGTLWHWLQKADRVVGVDDAMRAPGPDVWQEWAKKAGAELILIQGSSHDPAVIEQVRSLSPYGFCHIDADHSYAAVQADWENYRDMIEPNGIVCLHDIVPRQGYGVDQLWSEIKGNGRRTMEIVEDANSARCGIGAVWV
jgi:cephalosporin hydroxylase